MVGETKAADLLPHRSLQHCQVLEIDSDRWKIRMVIVLDAWCKLDQIGRIDRADAGDETSQLTIVFDGELMIHSNHQPETKIATVQNYMPNHQSAKYPA